MISHLVHPEQEIAKVLYVPLPQGYRQKSFLSSSATIKFTREGFFTCKKEFAFEPL